MRASIVIPTRNRWDTLAITLPTVLAQDELDPDVEVLVVDDGSDDEPCEIVLEAVRKGRVKLLRQQGRGPAAARNLAVRAALGDVVLFLDDDIVCPANLLRLHLEAHRERKELVSYGPVFLDERAPRTLVAERTGDWYRQFWLRINTQGGLKFPADTLLASNCAISRSVLLAIGGFDEAIASKEDTELGIRLWKRGTPMAFLPAVTAYELFVKSSGDHVLVDGENWGRAEVYLCQRHPEVRPHCGLSNLGASPFWMRWLRRLMLALPRIVHAWTIPIYGLLERVPMPRAIRRAVTGVMALHHRLSFLCGASLQAGGQSALEEAFGRRLPVLLYHHVGAFRQGIPAALTISVEAFERQIRWLRRLGFRGIRLSEWIACCLEGKSLPDRAIAITFDDGYEDTAKNALPILERYGFTATVFVVTGEIGGRNSWDESLGYAKLGLMDQTAIRAWADKGVEFGAHSRTHRDLTKLSVASKENEIAGSATDLFGLLGRDVPCFAYPYGYHDRETRAAAASRFKLAITCDEGCNSLSTDLYLQRRSLVRSDDSFIDFAGRVFFGWSPTSELRAWLAVRRRVRTAWKRVCGEGQRA